MPVRRSDDAQFSAFVPVLVVGGGACGMAAALAASDGGAEAMVLERDDRPHGSTGMSQGYIAAAGSRIQQEAGILDDGPDRLLDDILAKTRGLTDPKLARTYAEAAGPTVDWLKERHGFPLDLEPSWTHFGHSRPRLHGVPTRTGEELLTLFGNAAEKAGVPVTTGARVVDVLANGHDRVVGVEVERPDGRRETIGCDALVLATCGFGANRDMIRRFIPDMAEAPYFGHEGNEGDGIVWGMELGAAVGDMGAYQGYGALADPHGIIMNYDVVMTGGFLVNTLGRRFSDELDDISGQAVHVYRQPGNAAWIVYDERRHRDIHEKPEYRQLRELGAVRRGDTVEALAEAIKVPHEALSETFADVDRLKAAGEADAFGRDFSGQERLSPPFYAVRVKGALFHTQGGLVVDEHAQVCRPDGSRLPNLFAGGGAARSISGPGVWGYLPAAGLGMAVTLGRLAGEAAARLVRRIETGGAIATSLGTHPIASARRGREAGAPPTRAGHAFKEG